MSLLDIFNSVIKVEDKATLVSKSASMPIFVPTVKPNPIQNKPGNIMDIFNSVINPEPVKPKVPTYADILNSGTTKTDKVIISNIVASMPSPNNLLNELRNYVDKIKTEPSIKSWAEQPENDEESCD
jgi:hypothetical protein